MIFDFSPPSPDMEFTHLCAFRPVGEDSACDHDGGDDRIVSDAYRTALWCFSLYAHLRAADDGKGPDPVWRRLATFLDEMTTEVGREGAKEELLPGWAVVFRLIVGELGLGSIDREFHRLACAFVDCSVLHASGACGRGRQANETVTSALSQIAASLAAKRRAEMQHPDAA